MIFIWFRRTATSWEAQFCRVWIDIAFPRYWKTSGIGFIRLTDKDGSAR